MAFYLILSILSSTMLLVILKKFVLWRIDSLHGIIINYWTAALISFLITPQEILSSGNEFINLLPITMLIGGMFITVFYIMAKTTQQTGVGVASVASKMSMVIPITSGLILYDESFGVLKAMGILIAVPAVVITSRPSVPPLGERKFSWKTIVLPLLLFVGAGLVDTSIKFAQYYCMNANNKQLVIMSIFAFAGTFGVLRLIFELIIMKKKLLLRSVAGGILLGITNYLSLYFLVKCLETPGTESSTVFAFVNTGVVITSFMAGLWLFSEHADRNKIIGLGMAIAAIIVLSYS